jgi:hypothetical protein
VSDKTVMLIAIDSETPEGKALISEINGRFMRAEWVDREHYAPMVLLEKAEAENLKLKAIITKYSHCLPQDAVLDIAKSGILKSGGES